jgi:hypothetical protein
MITLTAVSNQAGHLRLTFNLLLTSVNLRRTTHSSNKRFRDLLQQVDLIYSIILLSTSTTQEHLNNLTLFRLSSSSNLHRLQQGNY